MRTLLFSAIAIGALVAATYATAGSYERAISHDSDGFDRYSRDEPSAERQERRENIRFENREHRQRTWSSSNDPGRDYAPTYKRFLQQSEQRQYERDN